MPLRRVLRATRDDSIRHLDKGQDRASPAEEERGHEALKLPAGYLFPGVRANELVHGRR